jgi:hypothetical protein
MSLSFVLSGYQASLCSTTSPEHRLLSKRLSVYRGEVENKLLRIWETTPSDLPFTTENQILERSSSCESLESLILNTPASPLSAITMSDKQVSVFGRSLVVDSKYVAINTL